MARFDDPKWSTSPPPATPVMTNREAIIVLAEYRVVEQRFDKGGNIYIIEHADVDSLGSPAWREVARISESFGHPDIEDFLYLLFRDIQEGRTQC